MVLLIRSENQIRVEESFMITIAAVMNASVSDILSSTDLMKIIETVLNLTNPNNAPQVKRRKFVRKLLNYRTLSLYFF
jgi:hypothetical protein